MPKCIDYARAESDDVVRKKFRRRVVWFLVVTVVVIVFGLGWTTLGEVERWLIGSRKNTLPVSVLTDEGWVVFFGPKQITSGSSKIVFKSDAIGVAMAIPTERGPSWGIAIRYRTLFILTMIPWLITLIRMIRTRQRIHRFETTNS